MSSMKPVFYIGCCVFCVSTGFIPKQYVGYRRQRFGHHVIYSSEASAELPSVDEAIAGAQQYVGPDILDPLQIHPNELPILDEFTCENFTMYYEEGGHAPWELDVDGVVGIRIFKNAKALQGLHHIFWAQASNTNDGPRVESSYQLLDPENFDLPNGQVVVAVDGTDQELVAFLRTDPEASLEIEKHEFFWHFQLNDDPYLNIHVLQNEMVPYVFWRIYDTSKKNSNKNEFELALKEHTSFLRKTKRVMRHAWLSELENNSSSIGEMFVAFFSTREEATTWVNADPFQKKGFYTLDFSIQRYNELDVTGTQRITPYPLNLFPDPVLSRLIDEGLKPLQTKSVQRMQPDPVSGEYRLYNITTNDPRVQSNVIDTSSLDPMRSINSEAISSDDTDDDDDPPDLGPTLDAAPDLYPTDVTDDYDA